MAKVFDNVIVAGLSGNLGRSRLQFKKGRNGKTIVALNPVFSENRIFNETQLAQQEAFRQATQYAKVARNQSLYVNLARGADATPYNLALSDWFNPPVIHEVSRGDSCIRVVATDNVQVTKVLIAISDDEGKTVEQGQATMKYDTLWEYTTSAPAEASVTVEAFDLAGNCTRHEA